MNLFTKELIPVVSTELIECVNSRVIDGKNGQEYFERVHDHIMRENYAIGEYLIHCKERNPDHMKGAGAGRSILTYALLMAMGDSLFLQGKQPELPEGGYTLEGLAIVHPDRFIELEEWFNGTPEDGNELVGILTSEVQDENPDLAEEIFLFRNPIPKSTQNTVCKNVAMLYLAMKRQSALYLSGAEVYCDID